MRFWKYQGCGNDFVVVDGVREKLGVDTEWSKEVCDRHFGIGADGVLYVLPGREGTDIEMVVVNSDGSIAEMCGNGIRCVSKFARDNGLVKSDEFLVMTGRGVLKAVTIPGADGKVARVRIDMGAPILEGREIPVDHDGRFIDQPFEAKGFRFKANAISMGNPHFITFDDLDDDAVDTLGPELEKHRFFPRKTNVEFARVVDGKIYIRVYERGAAWTLACGTGACATTTAAALNGLVPFGEPVDVHLPGGWLKITVDKDLGYVLMEGPAELVFCGDVPYTKH
jgi:diaminopimelate epimerase